MAAVSLFWDTNMAAVTSCENTLYVPKEIPQQEVSPAESALLGSPHVSTL